MPRQNVRKARSRDLKAVGNIEWRRGFTNKPRNFPTRNISHLFQITMKLFIHLIHPRRKSVPVRHIAFEILKEPIMDVSENEADALAGYEAEIASHRRHDIRSALRHRNVHVWGEHRGPGAGDEDVDRVVIASVFRGGWDLVVHVTHGQSEAEEVADEEELDFREGCAGDEVVCWWKERQEIRGRDDDGEHRYPIILGLPYTPYFSTQRPRVPEELRIRIDDGNDMGEWNVFPRCWRWTWRLDGLRVIRSAGEANGDAPSDFAKCLRDRVGGLELVSGLLVPKTPGSCLVGESDGMAIERDRRGID